MQKLLKEINENYKTDGNIEHNFRDYFKNLSKRKDL